MGDGLMDSKRLQPWGCPGCVAAESSQEELVQLGVGFTGLSAGLWAWTEVVLEPSAVPFSS